MSLLATLHPLHPHPRPPPPPLPSLPAAGHGVFDTGASPAAAGASIHRAGQEAAHGHGRLNGGPLFGAAISDIASGPAAHAAPAAHTAPITTSATTTVPVTLTTTTTTTAAPAVPPGAGASGLIGAAEPGAAAPGAVPASKRGRSRK